MLSKKKQKSVKLAVQKNIVLLHLPEGFSIWQLLSNAVAKSLRENKTNETEKKH